MTWKAKTPAAVGAASGGEREVLAGAERAESSSARSLTQRSQATWWFHVFRRQSPNPAEGPSASDSGRAADVFAGLWNDIQPRLDRSLCSARYGTAQRFADVLVIQGRKR